MATTANFSERKNVRQANELTISGEHIDIKHLKLRDELKGKQILQTYLTKDIPDYPTPVEFHITELKHVTNKHCLPGILNSGGFLGHDSLSWWNLKITQADITEAEERYLESFFPNSSKEERRDQQPFLSEFTTSPLFSETSRYGNYRFTFPLTTLMEAYKKQICDGEEPVLRVYGTKLFKQEIEYVVLVHSAQFNKKFQHLPHLASSPLVSYDGNKIIWKAQAICETHNFQLAKHDNTVVIGGMFSHQFYVWDHVSFVFHITNILPLPKGSLIESLECCEIDPDIDLSKKGSFSNLAKAKEFLKNLPECELEQDEKEEYNTFEEIEKEAD